LEREAAGNGLVVVRLTHGSANAMDTPMMRAMADEWRALAAEPTCRAVVVTASGPIFSAGAHLLSILRHGPSYLDEWLPALSDAFGGAFRFPKPMVAAVNGHAIAGGCVLTCAADYRLMAAGRSRIGVTELLVGVPFPLVPLEIMRFAAAPKELPNLLLGGGTFLPEDAVGQGLIDEVVPAAELLPRALAAAERLAALPPVSFQMTKRELRRVGYARMEQDLVASDKESRAVWGSDEVQAAMARYVEQTLGKRV
jgi:enoyl-CoA hydratase